VVKALDLVDHGLPFDGVWELARENWINRLPRSER